MNRRISIVLVVAAIGCGVSCNRADSRSAERDQALADLAAAEKKLGSVRRTIRRYAEELAYVDETNESLRRELESRDAASAVAGATAISRGGGMR